MQPCFAATDRPESAAQDRLEERKKMNVPGPVNKPGPGDDDRKAWSPSAPDRRLGVRLGFLVDIRGPERRVFAGRTITGYPENPGCAAVDEPFEAGRLLAAVEQQLRAQYVRSLVFRGRNARNQQWSGEMVDHVHAVHRGADRSPVVYIAYRDFRAEVGQRFRVGLRSRQHAYLHTVGEETLGQASTQEAGPACDECRHARHAGILEASRALGHAGGSRRSFRWPIDAT